MPLSARASTSMIGWQALKAATSSSSVLYRENHLSYECLTSPKTRKALRKYLEQDTILVDAIRARTGPCQDQESDQIEDDKDIPLPEVVDRVLRVRVRNAACRYDARCAFQAEGESGLSAADAEEDIWVYHPQGQLWTKARIPAEEKWSPEDENTGDDYYEPGDDD
ncbi:hypothetical protein B0H13DRAFT_1864442 [Mycena leptocephala]|nr:hypothetical protein B0H13DRAFT_1864442 [Mycena leptocephala]